MKMIKILIVLLGFFFINVVDAEQLYYEVNKIEVAEDGMIGDVIKLDDGYLVLTDDNLSRIDFKGEIIWQLESSFTYSWHDTASIILLENGNIMSVNGNGSVIVDVNDGSILYENSNLKVFDVTKFGENYFLSGGNGGQSYI